MAGGTVETIRIEFVKAWRGWSPGHLTEVFTPGQADMLFLRGIAKPAPVAAAVAAPAPEAPPAPAAKPAPRPARRN